MTYRITLYSLHTLRVMRAIYQSHQNFNRCITDAVVLRDTLSSQETAKLTTTKFIPVLYHAVSKSQDNLLALPHQIVRRAFQIELVTSRFASVE